MADLPPPPPSSDLPDVAAVTIVHKVKSKLGYTEVRAPFPGNENDKVMKKSFHHHCIKSRTLNYSSVFDLLIPFSYSFSFRLLMSAVG